MDKDIKARFDRIDAKLNNLHVQAKKQTWVSVSVLSELTGWSGSDKFRWARNNGLVTFDKEKGYLLESLNHLFILKRQCEHY